VLVGRDVREGLIAVRAKLKGGKMRYVPMASELAGELRRFPVVIGENRIFPPKAGATSGRQGVEAVSKIYSTERRLRTSAFAISVTRLRPGTG
jgi:hypothetical protein